MKTKSERLSKHFTLKEMTATLHDTFAEANANPGEDVKESLKELCEKVLEPIREHFKLPVIITSGYRCPGLNKKIGGSSTSQHIRGEACDFYVKGLDDMEGSMAVFDWIWKKSGIHFGQIIHEHAVAKNGYEKIWIHIGLGAPYRPKWKSGKVMKLRKGKYLMVRKNYYG